MTKFWETLAIEGGSMKNLKTALLILFAIIIVILIFLLAKNIKNNNNQSSENNKIISEINYMDSKLTNLLNSLNNITLDNYKVSATKTSTNDNTSSNSSNTSTEQYELKNEGILTSNSNINWDEIKVKVEVLYSKIPTITFDLYSMNINQDEILNFNKELDELTIAVKSEDKDKTLIKLANLYRYLPAYASNFSNDTSYVSLLETKSNVYKAYVFINMNNWDEASNYINTAIASYTKTLNNLQDKMNTYDTNKTYIILNELQNAINIQDREVFLIKYKKFLENAEKQRGK